MKKTYTERTRARRGDAERAANLFRRAESWPAEKILLNERVAPILEMYGVDTIAAEK